jgi:hypothetical protein
MKAELAQRWKKGANRGAPLRDGVGVAYAARDGAEGVVILRSGAASSGSCSRCAPRANVCQQMADKCDEPLLDDDT